MAIKEKIAATTELSYFEGRIPIRFRYTYGLAGETFFRQIKAGKLTASVAKESGTVYCPPRIFCEESFEAVGKTVELKGTGVVESFTISCEDGHGEPRDPVLLAFVRFDGADGGLCAPLKCPFEKAAIGQRVKLDFVPKNRRTGAITDVFFVPLKK